MTVTAPAGLWSFPCESDDCVAADFRPYSKGRKYPSVTETIEQMLGIGDGGAFKAAQMTAEYCYDYSDRFLSMNRDDAIAKARIVFKARWSTDADLGSHTHKAAEAFAAGTPWDMPDGEWDHDYYRLEKFVLGLKEWWAQRTPQVIASEFIVSREDPRYVGTADLLAVIADVPTLIDIKTHREHREDEELRFRKWDLQLQMLSLSDSVRHYHGRELIQQLSWEDAGLPRPTRGLIVSIGPEGQVREYETPIDEAANIGMIRALCDAKAWKPALSQCGNLGPVQKFEPRPDAPVSVSAFLD